MQLVLRGLLACATIVVCGAGCGSDDDDELVTPSEGGTGTDAGLDGSPPPGEGGTPAMDAPMTCGEFGQSEACGTCLASSICCDEGAACRGSAACTELVMCRRECSGADAMACLQDCFDQNATGGSAFNALTTCMGMECETECPFATP